MKHDVFLSVQGLGKRYKDLIAVDGISFSVYKGEVFGLLGPNGAGKTTTIKMLCGLLKADSGSVTFDGISMSAGYKRIKSMIGLCPQEIVIWELLTCLEQLRFVGMSYGLSSKTAEDKAEGLLQSLGLSDKRNKLAKTLSGGMQRRLNIALALVHDPELIILDEPQAGLDPQSRILVRDFIRQLAKKRTVILTTHDMDEADRLSDRVAIIDHGRILLIDSPERLKAKSGAGDILQVRANGLNEDMADKILKLMPSEFTEKKYSEGYLFLGAEDLLELIPAVSRTLKIFNMHMEDMTIRKRTLEDAFIAMTGRGLRE
ncbi:MAG: ABC transporter ATP-binding protein [Ruminiclostridium sp.]|nr:ABC transporter ATP-binding protein [Ruminiclostridium sp.]